MAQVHDERNKCSETGDSSIVLISVEHEANSRSGKSEGDKGCELVGKTSNEDCSIEVRGGGIEDSKAEKVCRICLLGSEVTTGESELMSLGCDCKGELGCSHRFCADAWFLRKGNRLCEICGTIAKNVQDNAEETSISMMDWSEMRTVAATLEASREGSRRFKESLRTLLLGCLVLAFVLPWVLRGLDVL